MSLNDEQASYVKALKENPDSVCGCGWFFKNNTFRIGVIVYET